jgi:hypothetical protein
MIIEIKCKAEVGWQDGSVNGWAGNIYIYIYGWIDG